MAILALFVSILYQRVTNRRTDVRHSCYRPIPALSVAMLYRW